jgi:copper homeostasis protein
MKQNTNILEVCAANIQSALAAQEGGAQRVELCDNLYEGGTTPSFATIQFTRENLDIGLNVLIRPRGGDFFYSRPEFEVMKEDIRICKDLKVDGVVIGILLPDGTVDKARMRTLIGLAKPMSVTFHRAFDMTPDPFNALEDIIELGCERILTSGQKNKVPEGIDLIKKLVDQAGDRILIMPGSGINEENIKSIMDQTGAREFHLTGRQMVESKMEYKKPGIFMGGLPQIQEYEIGITSVERIRKIINILKEN